MADGIAVTANGQNVYMANNGDGKVAAFCSSSGRSAAHGDGDDLADIHSDARQAVDVTRAADDDTQTLMVVAALRAGLNVGSHLVWAGAR